MIVVSERDGVVNVSVTHVCPISEADVLAVELQEICTAIAERADALIAVVLRGAADGFFLTPTTSAADCDAPGPYWRRATDALAAIPAPTLAVISGPAIGAAWELALACDLRLAANDVELGSPEVRWGRIPSAGGTQRLVRVAGPAQALELLLFGRLVSGAEATRRGLVHTAVPATELATSVDAQIATLRGSAPVALHYAKETALAASELRLDDGLRLEADLAALLQTTADRAEGLAAFLQKRPPTFIGN
jgi:enoyl-CoA hydratase/carnithine racemase